MKYFFIMNPGSKSGKSRRNFERIFRFLDANKIDYDYKITESLHDAYEFSLLGNKLGKYDVIVAVGGDGTINQVLNGFYDEEGSRLSSSRMGVVYTGTSPDFCKSYGIPIGIESALKVIQEANTRSIQVGKIILSQCFNKEYDDKPVDDGPGFKTRYFACCANIGLGAALARRANSGIRGIVGDKLGTFLSLIRTLVTFKPQNFTVVCDGEPVRIEKVHNISIGKTFYIASGIKVKNQLVHGDNSFYSLNVKNIAVKNWIEVIDKIYSGRQIENDDMVSLSYHKTIEIYGNSKNPQVEFDGDPAGFLPCSICMAKDELGLIYNGDFGKEEYGFREKPDKIYQ